MIPCRETRRRRDAEVPSRSLHERRLLQ